jgi:nitrate/nitrite-specific signal transduction histidine kinase
MKTEMSFKIKRLSSRVLLANLLFLLTMAAVVDLVIYFGFRQARDNANSSSAEALTDQGRDALRQMTEQEATFADRQLAQAAALGQVAADYLKTMQAAGGKVPWDMRSLTIAPGGQRYDASTNRRTEVWIGPNTTVDNLMQRDLQETAVFDTLFPTLITESPDAVAIYYMGATGLGRYYPVTNLVERLPPDFSIVDQPFYALAGPDANPVRTTIWSPPYEDFAGLGPIVTASTPVYQDGNFRGVIGVDISLVQLIERLNRLSPTTSGYAFLVDSGGRLVAASPNALSALLGPEQTASPATTLTTTLGIPLYQSDNPQVLAASEQMRLEESGLVELELSDQAVLLAHAPLPTVGWHLGLVAPVAEIASRSQGVATAIRQDATDTLRSTTLVLTAFFLLVLLLVGYVNRRLIVQRIEALAGGVQAIASGDLDVRVPPQGEDEIGLLAHSFNDMAGQLAAARDQLEARVARRTRELAALYEVTAVASASLDLEDVLNRSLAQVVAVMNGRSGSIHLLDETGQSLQLVAAYKVPTAIVTEIEQVPLGTAVVGQVIGQEEPLYIPVLDTDSDAVPASVTDSSQNSFLGAPLHVKGKVIGVLSVIGQANQQFSPEEVILLGAIADQVGVAVENARLYLQAEELAVVQERQRLARELHDAVTQSVYSATLLAATGQRALAAGDWEQVANYLSRLQAITGQALKELRLLVYELRPSALEDAGLVEALQHRLDAVESRVGIQARLLVDDDLPLDEAQEAGLYRVSVEALNNALKHAEATAVAVRITRHDGTVTLTVEDDGRGFDTAVVSGKGGFGLQSMQERARQLFGDLVIESEIGQGTAVILRLPKEDNHD